jgi:hypothetical protein
MKKAELSNLSYYPHNLRYCLETTRLRRGPPWLSLSSSLAFSLTKMTKKPDVKVVWTQPWMELALEVVLSVHLALAGVAICSLLLLEGANSHFVAYLAK